MNLIFFDLIFKKAFFALIILCNLLAISLNSYGLDIIGTSKDRIAALKNESEEVLIGDKFFILNENQERVGIAEVIKVRREKVLLKFSGKAQKNYQIISIKSEKNSNLHGSHLTESKLSDKKGRQKLKGLFLDASFDRAKTTFDSNEDSTDDEDATTMDMNIKLTLSRVYGHFEPSLGVIYSFRKTEESNSERSSTVLGFSLGLDYNFQSFEERRTQIPFASLSLLYLKDNSEIDGSGFVASAGGGVKLFLSESAGVRGEFTVRKSLSYELGDDSMNTFGFGGRFGLFLYF